MYCFLDDRTVSETPFPRSSPMLEIWRAASNKCLPKPTIQHSVWTWERKEGLNFSLFSRSDCLKMCAVLPIFKRLSRLPPSLWRHMSMSVHYNHFCLPTEAELTTTCLFLVYGKPTNMHFLPSPTNNHLWEWGEALAQWVYEVGVEHYEQCELESRAQV